MEIIISVYLFVVGLAFGSFALAMVDRMHSGKDWVKGRSACDSCGHKLGARDLVPVVSWFSQGGKCRYCRKKLSWAYPAAEMVSGVAFVLSYIYFPYDFNTLGITLLVFWLFGLVICAALIIFDLRWFLLPSKLVYSLVVVALLHKIVYIIGSDDSISSLVIKTLGALIVSSGLFYVLHAISHGKWIGDGDVRLGLAIGLLVEGPIEAWLVIFIASLLGIIIALPKIAKKKDVMKMKLPYGPLLIAGLYITYLFGGEIIMWYSERFLYL